MTRMALRQLGMKVQALRDKRAMTQAALAKKARISRGPPGNGAPEPTLTMLRKLARAFGVPVTALLE